MKFFLVFSKLNLGKKIYLGLVVAGIFFLVFYFTGIIKIPSSRVYDCSTVKNYIELEVQIGATFEPSKITAYVCDRIRFTAADDQEHWPAIGPHPTHTSYPGFDAERNLKKGESFEFVLNRAGTYSFHDHTHPEIIGTITINPEPRSLTPPARP